MYAIADQVRQWLEAGEDVTVAQVVATRGFSSRDPAAAAAWTAGESVGAVLEGIDTGALAQHGPGLHEVLLTDEDAQAVGLSCGGRASVLVQPATAFGAGFWERLAAREPVCVVTEIGGGVTVHTPETIRDAHAFGDRIPRLFARGQSATDLLDDVEPALAVVALWPVPTLVVVGDGLIAAALANAAALLEWQSAVTNDVEGAVAAVEALHPSDAVVVLSHSREVDGPTLAAALAGSARYVGALGSRRTQAARREWLTERGVPEQDQRRIHGPAGLDIDAHTPGEIAVSIVAEILAVRAHSSGGALRDREGPVHAAGVNAPPPRYG